MTRRSLTLAFLLLVLAATWQCGQLNQEPLLSKNTSVIPPARDILRDAAEKPTRSPLLPRIREVKRYTMRVFQTVKYDSGPPISPIEALKRVGARYTVRNYSMGDMVESVNGSTNGNGSWWIFAVNDWLPDEPDSWIIGLGAKKIFSSAEAELELPRFTRGFLKVMSATGQMPGQPITAATVFAPRPGQNKIRITWLLVGPRVEDK